MRSLAKLKNPQNSDLSAYTCGHAGRHSDPPSTPNQPGFTTPPVTPWDNIFSGVKIASAYLYLQEHHALKWPSNDDRASLMGALISVSALRAGMVLAVLQFGGPEAFATLVEPDAYYVVTAVEHQDKSMRLSLAYVRARALFHPA